MMAEDAARLERQRRPLLMSEFLVATGDHDLEAACHFVFGRAHTKWSDQGRASLSVGECTVVAVETFFGETCNGGLIQYLGNDSGEFVPDLPEALMRVGLAEFVPIALEVKGLFPQPIAEDSDDRWRQIEKIEEVALERLSDKFFSLFEVTRFRECLAGFIRHNPGEFVANNGG